MCTVVEDSDLGRLVVNAVRKYWATVSVLVCRGFLWQLQKTHSSGGLLELLEINVEF